MVARTVQAGGDPDTGSCVMGVFCGQHSIETAPAVTEPLPVIRNVTNLGSRRKSVFPFPEAAKACSAVVTFSRLIAFSFVGLSSSIQRLERR